MRDIIIIDLLTQCHQVIHNHLEPMEHLQNALIILHLKACELVIENVQLDKPINLSLRMSHMQ